VAGQLVADHRSGSHPDKYWTVLYRAKENPATAKIVKIKFNANLDILGFPHFITFKECRKMP